MKKNGVDYETHNYFSMQGNNLAGVKERLTQLHDPPITQVVMVVDNDKTGDKYRTEIRSILKECGFEGNIFDRRPKGNDFNDDLKAMNEPANRAPPPPAPPEPEID